MGQLVLNSVDVNDIVNSLTAKANSDRNEAKKCIDPKSGEIRSEELCRLYFALVEQAKREDELADRILNSSIVEREG